MSFGPLGETSGWKQWTGPLQRAAPSRPNSAKQVRKRRGDVHPNLRTQEVTDLSSVVSAKIFHSNLTVWVLFV